ncbi:TIGR01666 family membrane protein [Xanthomonas citri pv. mangiferaeindicae]|nr:TIGR01666 family membrane protein [Xanthomonas citri pv. mangiferaeindicae]
MPSPINERLTRLWAHEKASTALRVSIAFGGAMALCWQFQQLAALPAVFLGIIASAIAETDDNGFGRTKAVLLSLLCFGAAAGAITLLFPYPLAFIACLAATTFALTLLGALGERYASIAQGTVALMLYAAIGIDQHGVGDAEAAWRGAGQLLAGAAWYGALSILWTILFANRPVRERLARLFAELGRYLQLKAALFEPIRDRDLHARRLALSEQNARVVAALEATKNAIISRFGRSGRPGVQSGLYFRLYYMAQEFHERASSSHYPYEALAEAFFHSDVLYRGQRLLELQGRACRALGEAIRLRRPFQYGAGTRQAMVDLRQSLDHLHARGDGRQTRLLASLESLVRNLQAIDRRLAEDTLSDAPLDGMDTRLRDASPHTLREMATRLGRQLSPTSVLFRHGLRMAIALCAGYAVMHAIGARNGFWILLTIAFVCRPSFGATRRRLAQRIAGTLLGLAATWALMQLFVGVEVQLLLALLAAVVFFVSRTDRYALATAAITVMALLCFNLIGDGFVLIWPRLLDTLIGCAIAAAASFLILPDWRGRQLHLVMAGVVDAHARYLGQVLEQYRSGMRDDLPYRVARRDMHNAEAALSVALSNRLREPGRYRRDLDAAFRFLAVSNTALGYLSGLGAHRGTLDSEADEAVFAAGTHLQRALAEIAAALSARRAPPVVDATAETAMAEALERAGDATSDPRQRLLGTQLALLLRLLPDLRNAAEAAGAPAAASRLAAAG